MERRLRIDLESFPAKNEARVRGIETTLKSVFDEFMKAFDGLPDAGVNVAWWASPQPPKALFDWRPYEIRINAQGNGWPQYAYQFAHELCHVMTNFDRAKKHKHKWFEESLCEMASLFVLYRLADVWAANPPAGITYSQSFAQEHANYARDVERKYPAVPRSELPQWLEANIRRMEASSTERDLNGIVAVSLLGFFRQDPSLWRDCAWLNHWDPMGDGAFGEYLDSWDAFLNGAERPGRVPAQVRALFF